MANRFNSAVLDGPLYLLVLRPIEEKRFVKKETVSLFLAIFSKQSINFS
jgi:hypothetical protein